MSLEAQHIGRTGAKRLLTTVDVDVIFLLVILSINPKTNLMDDLYLTLNTNILKCENWPCSCFNKWFVTTGEVSQLLDAGSNGSPRIKARYGWTLSTLKV